MKKLFKNPLFYLSVVLIIAVGFTVFNLVKAGVFQEPTKPFPESDVEAPIDESGINQTKSGFLTLINETSSGGLGGLCLLKSTSDSNKACRSYWEQFESDLEVRGFGDYVYGSRTSGPSGDNLGEWDFCALDQVLTTEKGGNDDLRGCQLTKSGNNWILSTIGDARCGARCFNLLSPDEESGGRSGSRR